MADIKNNTTPAENKKAETKANKPQEKKPNIFSRLSKKLAKFCKDTVGELKKVVWTSKSETWKSLKLVIAAVVSLSVAIALIDYVASVGIKYLASLIG